MVAKEKHFYVHEGRVLKNLKDLARELTKMPKHIYDHHVKSEKNDFSSWVSGALGEHELAAKIDGQISRIELELEVLRHIVHVSASKKRPTKKKPAKKAVKKPATKSTKKPTKKTN